MQGFVDRVKRLGEINRHATVRGMRSDLIEAMCGLVDEVYISCSGRSSSAETMVGGIYWKLVEL